MYCHILLRLSITTIIIITNNVYLSAISESCKDTLQDVMQLNRKEVSNDGVETTVKEKCFQ